MASCPSISIWGRSNTMTDTMLSKEEFWAKLQAARGAKLASRPVPA